MIEVTISYDLAAGIDQQAYVELAKKVVGSFLKADGIVEFRANRNLLGSPRVRATCVWESLDRWARYSETTEFQVLWDDLQNYVTDPKVDVWAASPVIPDPIRPGS